MSTAILQQPGVQHAVKEIAPTHLSVVFPFEPKMSAPSSIRKTLHLVLKKAERLLYQRCERETAVLLWQRLNATIRNLNYDTYRKTVAIFLSTEDLQCHYLDIATRIVVSIGDHYAVEEMLRQVDYPPQCLVLLMKKDRILFYEASIGRMKRVAFYTSYDFRLLEGKQELTDAGKVYAKELAGLFRYPLFVVGEASLINTFRGKAGEEISVAKYISCTETELNEAVLFTKINAELMRWSNAQQSGMHAMLDDAFEKGNVIAGLEAVQKAVSKHAGKRVFVSEKFNQQLASYILCTVIPKGYSITILPETGSIHLNRIAMIVD